MTNPGSLKAKLDIHLQEEILRVVQLRGVWLTIVCGGGSFSFFCGFFFFWGGGGGGVLIACFVVSFVFSVASWSITDLYSI